jgi:hypothetical protein
MSAIIIVIDTSYLFELAGCDEESPAKDKVRAKFAQMQKRGGRFFVPLPCLFELGDHISNVKHVDERTKLAKWLIKTVDGCLVKSNPWTITPTGRPTEILPALMARFERLAVRKKIGMVDAFAAEEASRLKARFRNLKGRVHIWTNDEGLKAEEPDQESDAYLWHSDGMPR